MNEFFYKAVSGRTLFVFSFPCSSSLAEFVTLPVNCSMLHGIKVLGKSVWEAPKTTSVVVLVEDPNWDCRENMIKTKHLEKWFV